MKRVVLALALAAAALLGAVAALPALAGETPTTAPAPEPNPVVEWNQFLLGIQATAGNQPATIHPTYELAIMHAAIYDAVVSIDHSATPYVARVHAPRSASPAAAADAAAHDTLVALYPELQSSIDQEYSAQLAQLPSDRHTLQGVRAGQDAAHQVLAARVDDGSGAPLIPFQPGSRPGDYQLTPPAFAQPAFTHWRFVTPFALRRADQFRPPAPPPLTSPTYAAAINEVKALGVADGSSRTADQTQIGVFWNLPIWATWNRIAETAALAHAGTVSEDARTFAALDLTFADSVIAFYDAKYAYRLWRPVTAIRNADGDGNPDTAADRDWTPLSATAPDPSYPGAHATISAAGATVLSSIYGDEVPFTLSSPALPGVERAFASFSDAAGEAAVSRIYNGNHTRIDEAAGESLGHDVADFVLHDELLPRHAYAR